MNTLRFLPVASAMLLAVLLSACAQSHAAASGTNDDVQAAVSEPAATPEVSVPLPESPDEQPVAPAPAIETPFGESVETPVVIAAADDPEATAGNEPVDPAAIDATSPPPSLPPADADPADEVDNSETTASADKDEARALLEGYLAATRSLRADFQSRLLDERRVPLAESSGVVMVKRPNRFRWEYREPSPSLILADGTRLWSYDAELEQAVVRDMADLKGANPSSLLGADSDIDEDFDIAGLYRAGDLEWVELEPKGGTSDFTRVRLAFKSGSIELMELHDQLGQVTQIQFIGLELNAELADALFRFDPPPGVDVVGSP